MKNIKNKLFAAIMSMTIGLTGCSVIETDVQNPITDIFDEYGIDYNSFSEPAQEALDNIHAEHFFEVTEKIDDGFSVSIEALSGVYSLMTENELEAAALLNASYEDIIIQYDISVTNANAAAIYYAIEEYSNECIRNDKPIKAGEYINKVSVNSGNSNIKCNGKNSDLKHFIDNVINYEARGGYYYVKVNDFGSPLAVYWSKEKSTLKSEDDLISFYRYDFEEYQNGADIVGSYPVTFTVRNSTLGRVMKKTVLANEESRDVDESEDMSLYDKLFEMFKEEVEYNIDNSETDEKNTKDKTDEETILVFNTNAKQVHTAIASCITQASINAIDIPSSELLNNYNGDTELFFGNYNAGLEQYLGNSFEGYYYVYLNPDTYSVYFALWSEEPISDEYKYQLTEDEQKKFWNKNVKIGCYPYAADSKSAYRYSAADIKTDAEFTNKQSVNPFEGLKVEFDGASPYLKASVNTSGCNDETKENVVFSVKEEPLRLGDSVTVTAEWNDDCGIEFSQSSMEYAVENTAYYLDSLDGVDLSELNQLMDDYVEAEANKYVNDSVIFGKASHHEPWYNGESFTIGYNPIVTGIGKINVSSNYFLSLKQSSSLYQDEVYNKYMGIYEVEYSTYRKATDEYSNNTAILAVFIDNIVISTDGTLKYNSTENLNSKMFYREVEDTIAIIESNYVIAEKAQYNVTQIK